MKQTPKDCRRCGYCCSLTVKLADEDIARIKKKGYDEDYFVEEKGQFKCLKRINGYCVFLKIDEGIASCRIYPFRPNRCVEYPGKDTCDLIKHYVVNSKGDS